MGLEKIKNIKHFSHRLRFDFIDFIFYSVVFATYIIIDKQDARSEARYFPPGKVVQTKMLPKKFDKIAKIYDLFKKWLIIKAVANERHVDYKNRD